MKLDIHCSSKEMHSMKFVVRFTIFNIYYSFQRYETKTTKNWRVENDTWIYMLNFLLLCAPWTQNGPWPATDAKTSLHLLGIEAMMAFHSSSKAQKSWFKFSRAITQFRRHPSNSLKRNSMEFYSNEFKGLSNNLTFCLCKYSIVWPAVLGLGLSYEKIMAFCCVM